MGADKRELGEALKRGLMFIIPSRLHCPTGEQESYHAFIATVRIFPCTFLLPPAIASHRGSAVFTHACDSPPGSKVKALMPKKWT